ncbi:MAG: GTPase Era [Polyangiaceae bacterium]
MTSNEQPPAATRAGHVALVGRPNVGKSTLLNALVREPLAITSPHPQTTREPVRGIVTEGDTQFLFVDTPGIHAPRSRLGRWMNDVALHAARSADIVVLLVEAPSDHASHGAATVGPHSGDAALALELVELPTVVAINKIDRTRDKSALLPFIAALGALRPFEATVPICAKTGDGLDRLLSELGPRLPKQPFLYSPEELSDQPERFFVAELVREQVVAHLRDEVPHGVAVTIEAFERTPNAIEIHASVHVARVSHKKIVIGAQGAMLKAIGSAARVRIERLLGTHVRLNLWVRDSPDWMNDEARMRELGYGGRTDDR